LTTQEAVLSSKIEGTQATLGEVLKYEAGEEPLQDWRREDIQEILNYRRALQMAQKSLTARPFNLNLLLELHSILLDSVRGRSMGRGRFRTSQNWIGSPGTPIEAAQFVPPEPSKVPGCMDNFEKYYHSDAPDLLVQLAILHAQFEIVHPFLDGNGRLGRIIIPLFLFEKELLSEPVFYMSAYIERNRDEYVTRLRALRDTGDAWNRWIEFFLIAMTEQARSIINLYADLKTRVIDLTHSRFAVPLLDSLFEQPIFSASALFGRAGLPSKPMITEMLSRLRVANILTVLREASGRRAQILAFPELLSLCEEREVFPSS
jgi:Fic family protein